MLVLKAWSGTMKPVSPGTGGPADGVVQPAKDTAAMKMTRSAITLESIQIPWLADRINKT